MREKNAVVHFALLHHKKLTHITISLLSVCCTNNKNTMSHNDQQQKQQPRIVEDRPVFHGMAVGSRLLEPALKFDSSPIAIKTPSPAVRNVQGLKKTTDNTPTLWPAKTDLEPLPVIYMLERTHVCITDTCPQEIGRRVARCLQQESIAADFHDVEAVIDAETSDCVQFSVRLWSGDAKNQVLVEVQKASGCSYLYCQAARAILMAAKGLEPQTKKRQFTIPKCVIKDAAAAASAKVMQQQLHDSNATVKEGIEIAYTLLQRKRLDSRLMAVESLVQISKASPFAAHVILCEKEELRAALLAMVEGGSPVDNGRGCSEMEKEHNRLMSRHALAVLANCLEALEHSGELQTVLVGEKQGGEELFCAPKMLETLIAKVQASEENPHEACQALRCIGSLVRGSGSDDMKQNALALGFYEYLAAAHVTGGRFHARLEQECARLSL